MSDAPTEWHVESRERVPLVRWWRTVRSDWMRTPDGGEAFVRLQRHRLLPWRGRRVTTTFDDREVTG